MLVKLAVLCLTVFSLSFVHAADMPLPLPDDPGQQQPGPTPNPEPNPGPAPYPTPPPPGKPYAYNIGGAQTSRFSGDRPFQFFPAYNLTNLIRLRLTGARNTVAVGAVWIQYAYGDPFSVYGLSGDLGVGQTKEIVLDGRPIYSILVRANPKFFWKKAGSFRIDATALR